MRYIGPKIVTIEPISQIEMIFETFFHYKGMS